MNSLLMRALLAAGLITALFGCGGGGGNDGSSSPAQNTAPAQSGNAAGSPSAGGDPNTQASSATGVTPQTTTPPGKSVPGSEPKTPPPTPPGLPINNLLAARFLTQASFGPSVPDVNRLLASGYTAWLDDQFAKSQTLHRTYLDALPSGTSVNQTQFFESYWQQAALGEDQLRQRVAFALSEIFVVSGVDSTVSNFPRGMACYYDMLASHAFSNFRNLLEGVTLHPMMGIYLSSLRNEKESGSRIPDQNFAREVMQLFSIGLYELNPDGTYKLSGGAPVETYQDTDIVGLSRVFTGWSWAGPDKTNNRFYGSVTDPNRDCLPMQSYPNFHSTLEKQFLGKTIAASSGNAEADLKVALDALFNHPNVGPFIGRQLIQRLVTSNPSPQYVARVAAAFANNGAGVRGDMKAVIRAVLLDDEARADAGLSNPNFGKLREPVIRLANWMRAFNAKSTSSRFLIGNLDDPLGALGQTPMRSPSVFNFFRPGYVPPNSFISAASLVAPEMQITGEISVVGYLNFMRSVIPGGIGTGTPRDVQADYSTEIALADNPATLLDRINVLLMYGQMSPTLRSQIMDAVNSVPLPAAPTSQDAARKNRVHLAIFLTMASPEYIVQK